MKLLIPNQTPSRDRNWRRWLRASRAGMAPVFGYPLTLLFSLLPRGRCPHCGRRGSRGALCTADPQLTGDPRRFYFIQCKHCHHQFWRLTDSSTIHIEPTDARYTRTT